VSKGQSEPVTTTSRSQRTLGVNYNVQALSKHASPPLCKRTNHHSITSTRTVISRTIAAKGRVDDATRILAAHATHSKNYYTTAAIYMLYKTCTFKNTKNFACFDGLRRQAIEPYGAVQYIHVIHVSMNSPTIVVTSAQLSWWSIMILIICGVAWESKLCASAGV
jgi:hypothetical protein